MRAAAATQVLGGAIAVLAAGSLWVLGAGLLIRGGGALTLPGMRAWRGFRGISGLGVLLGVLVGVLSLPLTAAAHQRYDWLLSAPGEEGTYLNLDAIFGGVQAGVERRYEIYGQANQLTLRGSALAAIPFGSTQLDADLRLVILTLGTSVGAADVWRNQTFADGQPLDRKERRQREAAGEFDSNVFGFWEGRVQLTLPFNDYVLFNNVNSYRITGAEERTFDNLVGVVHDGDYFRADFQLFLKHRDFGGLAPVFQVLDFPLDGARHTQLNYGFLFVTRAALVGRDDLVVFQMLFHSDALGGYDNSDVYGMAILRGPATFTLAYRSVISL